MQSPGETDIAVQLYSLSTNSLHTLWGLLSVVALALVGYTWGTKDPLRAKAKLVLGIGFFLFAAVNHRAITQAQTLLLKAASVLAATPPDASPAYDGMIGALIGTPIGVVRLFYALVVVGVLLALYYAPRSHSATAA